jgi:uncharacterized protein CbrC (UPF0167 family)
VPIIQLEALSYGLLPLVTDIQVNTGVWLEENYCSACDDVCVLRSKLSRFITNETSDAEKGVFQSITCKSYNWHDIAKQTNEIYRNTTRGKS